MRLDELTDLLPLWFLRMATFAFGLLWGSFLNVVIYRVPRGMSVVRPASHCPGCGKPVAAYDNIPVLSYVVLRGRARCCRAPMSPRYPLVELIGGALSLAIFEVVILNLPGETSAGHAAAIYGADFALCLGLVAAAFIDAEHMILPDSITFGGTVVGILTSSFRGLDIADSIVGATVGFLVVFVPFIFLYKGLLGRTGMGLGDAKLLALAGAWFGWPGALFALFAGSLQGSLYALVTRALGIEPKLPDAVLEDIAELKKAAAEGDEEARRALDEDPLTEDEGDAFILRFFQRLLGTKNDVAQGAAANDELNATLEVSAQPDVAQGATANDELNATLEVSAQPDVADRRDDDVSKDAETHKTTDASDDVLEETDAPMRARIPFGPFLILAILELLFAGDWVEAHLMPLL